VVAEVSGVEFLSEHPANRPMVNTMALSSVVLENLVTVVPLVLT
jgi:hypothetical protein